MLVWMHALSSCCQYADSCSYSISWLKLRGNSGYSTPLNVKRPFSRIFCTTRCSFRFAKPTGLLANMQLYHSA